MIRFKEFSEAHKEYISKCAFSTFNIAEGAVRSGKTIANLLAFAFELEKTPDTLHLASGVTLSAARLNLGDCNGFGLEHLFRGRCRWGRYNGCESLYIRTKTGRKVVLFTGGGLSDSYKKIRGNSYGMWIATEVNKHYLSNDDTSFLNEAFNRQLAAENRKIFWDLNPDYPTHPIYTEYIDKYLSLGMPVNYRRFTMADNLSISEKRRQEIEAQYDPGSVWYKRSILGLRVAAEGLIFRQFADSPERWICSSPPEDIEFISIGGDYGGNLSKTVFVATGIRKNFAGVCVLRSHKVAGEKGEISPGKIESEFLDFVRSLSVFPWPVFYAFMDGEGQYLTNGIVRASAEAGLSLRIGDCRKNRIVDRIACKSRLIAENRWKVLEGCREVIDSTATQVWDPKNPDRRLDNGSRDIDTADAEEYSWEAFMKKF